MTIVVTSGSAYTDIDAYACAIALAEALTANGKPATAWLPGPANASIPTKFRTDAAFNCTRPSGISSVILVDLSDPDHIPPGLVLDQVSAVFDHHIGFQSFWDSVPARVRIEPVGAAATLIWEEVDALGLSEVFSGTAMEALAAAIVSNTADFRLPLTTERDRLAFRAIEVGARLAPSWRHAYFAGVDQRIYADLKSALKADTKIVRLTDGKSLHVGQIEVYDGHVALEKLADLASEVEDFPDIMIVPDRKNLHTHIATKRAEVIWRLSKHYKYNNTKIGVLQAFTVSDLIFRKSIIPVLYKIFPDYAPCSAARRLVQTMNKQ